jgi:hypothetical protein
LAAAIHSADRRDAFRHDANGRPERRRKRHLPTSLFNPWRREGASA